MKLQTAVGISCFERTGKQLYLLRVHTIVYFRTCSTMTNGKSSKLKLNPCNHFAITDHLDKVRARQHRDYRSHFNVVSSEWESIRSVLSCLPALLSTEIIVRMQLQFALLLIAATCFVSSTADASYSALCDSVWLLLIRIMRCASLFSIALLWIDIFFLQKNKILLWE